MSTPPVGPPPPEQPGGPTRPGQGTGPGTERTVLVLTHLAAPISWLLTAGSLGVIGPLVVWLVYRNSNPQVRATAAGAFNFNLFCWLGFWLVFILGAVTLGFGWIIGIPIVIVVFILAVVLHIRGALAASRGEFFRYPLQLPVLS